MPRVRTTTAFYTLLLLRSFPDEIFIFGDNIERHGYGGQAAIRGEPNARGVVTKRAPSDEPDAFMSDCSDDLFHVLADLEFLVGLSFSRNLVLPVLDTGHTSLGCGLADLPNRAPRLYQIIDLALKNLITG